MSRRSNPHKCLVALVLTLALPNLSASVTSVQDTGSTRIHAGQSALSCASISPRLLALGDAYFDLPQDDRSRSAPPERSRTPRWAHDTQHPDSDNTHDPVLIDRLLDRLSTMRWRAGSGQRLQCLGSADRVREHWQSLQLEDIRLTADTGNGNRRSLTHVDRSSLSGFLRSSPSSRRQFDMTLVLNLHEHDEQQHLKRRRSLTLPIQDLTPVDDTTWLITSQQRVRQKTVGGSHLREIVTSALVRQASVLIEQSLHVNGTLAEWSSWELHSD